MAHVYDARSACLIVCTYTDCLFACRYFAAQFTVNLVLKDASPKDTLITVFIPRDRLILQICAIAARSTSTITMMMTVMMIIINNYYYVKPLRWLFNNECELVSFALSPVVISRGNAWERRSHC